MRISPFAVSEGSGALPFPRLPFAVRRLAPSTLVLLLLFVGLLATGSSLLNDPDTQWHIAVGRRIWAAREVPTTDLFSHTFKGAPWIAKEWLSQLIFYAAYRLASWNGVVVVAAAAIALSFASLHEWLHRRLQPTVAIAATLVAVTLALSHFLARPHILVLPIIVLWMIAIVSALDRKRVPAVPLALMMTLWANMHGSFPLGLVMAGVLAGEGIVDAPTGLRLTRLRQWTVFLVASLAATMIAPHGLAALLVSLKMSGNAETLRYVDEWQPLQFDVTGCVALGVLALLTIVMARDLRANLFRLIATGLLAYLMIRHARFISLFAVITPILAARAIALWPDLAAKPETDGTPALWGPILALLAVAAIAVAVIRPEPADDVTPDAAYRAALAAGVSGPVYNDYDFGGFLIAHGVETFVDGRTDQLFLGRFLPDLSTAIATKEDARFSAFIEPYHVTWALVRTDSGEARHFTQMGWRLIHTDKVATVYKAE